MRTNSRCMGQTLTTSQSWTQAEAKSSRSERLSLMFPSTTAENFRSWDKFLDVYYGPDSDRSLLGSPLSAKGGRTTWHRAFS